MESAEIQQVIESLKQMAGMIQNMIIFFTVEARQKEAAAPVKRRKRRGTKRGLKAAIKKIRNKTGRKKHVSRLTEQGQTELAADKK